MLFYLQYIVQIGGSEGIELTKIPFQFAVIPMILYLSSSVSSAFLKRVYLKLGRFFFNLIFI